MNQATGMNATENSFDGSLRLLRWAVLGGEAPAAAGNSQDMLALFITHRVVGRVLERIDEEAPGWAGAELLTQLRAHHEKNEAFFHDQRKALKRLTENYLGAENEIMVMKGFSCHLLTGRRAAIRESYDLDIVVADPNSLIERMKADNVSEYRHVSPHELLNAEIEGVHIDLHGYYPSWRSTPDAGYTRLDSIGDIAYCHHHGKLVVDKLTADCLFENPVRDNAYDFERVYIAEPAICALIICAHSYRNYLSRSSVTVRNKPPVRFVDLAELNDLLSLEAFDTERFCTLTRDRRAEASVRWAAHLLHDYLDDDRMLQALIKYEIATETAVPAPISVWGGFWSALTYRPADHFHRRLSTHAVATRYGAGTLRLKTGSIRRVDLTDPRRPNGLPPHTTLHGYSGIGRMMPLAFAIDVDTDQISLDISVTTEKTQVNQRIAVDINGYAFEWNWNHPSETVAWKQSHLSLEPLVDWSLAPGRFDLKVRFDRADLDLFQASHLPLLVCAGEFEEEHIMHRGTLVPLFVDVIDHPTGEQAAHDGGGI